MMTAHSPQVRSWMNSLNNQSRVFTLPLITLLLFALFLCHPVEADPIEHVYLVVYTKPSPGTNQRIIMGAEEIPAEELGVGEHPAPEINLLANIQTKQTCRTPGLCTLLDMQTHTHHSVINDTGDEHVITVHTAMVELDQHWSEDEEPHAYLYKGMENEVDLKANLPLLIRDGNIYPLLEVQVPSGKKDLTTTLVAGKYTPKHAIATIATFPPKGTVVVEFDEHLHGLALFKSTTKTFASKKLAQKKSIEKPLLHYLDPRTEGMTSMTMLPTQWDIHQNQPASEPDDFDSALLPSLKVKDKPVAPKTTNALLTRAVIHATAPLENGKETEVEFILPPGTDTKTSYLGLYSQSAVQGPSYRAYADLSRVRTGDPGPHTTKIKPSLQASDERWTNLYIGKKTPGYIFSSGYELNTMTKSAAYLVQDPQSSPEKPTAPIHQRKNLSAVITVAPRHHTTRAQQLQLANETTTKQTQKVAKLSLEKDNLNKELSRTRDELDRQTTMNLANQQEWETKQQEQENTVAQLMAALDVKEQERLKPPTANKRLQEEQTALQTEFSAMRVSVQGKTDQLKLTPLPKEVKRLTGEPSQLPTNMKHQSPTATFPPQKGAPSPKDMRCTILGGMGKGGICNGASLWSKAGYKWHLRNRHPGQNEIGTTGYCPGCNQPISSILHGRTDMKTFLAHINKCTGFIGAK